MEKSGHVSSKHISGGFFNSYGKCSSRNATGEFAYDGANTQPRILGVGSSGLSAVSQWDIFRVSTYFLWLARSSSVK